MNGKNADKPSDAARSDPLVADDNRNKLAKQAEQKLKEADRKAPKGNPDGSR
jgi:hypothetical protein